MRVLMTVSSSSLMDGVGRHILAIASTLNRMPEVEVGVVTLHVWGDLNDALHAAGVKCWSLSCANGHQIKVVSRFYSIMRDFRPNIVHGHVTCLFENIVLKWIFPRIKYVVTVHGISDPVVRGPFQRRLCRNFGLCLLSRFIYRRVDAYIYISQGVLAARAQRGNKNKAYVVYNPMDFSSREKPANCSNRQVIGTACRIESVKDPLAFTRILGEVTRRTPNAEAWVIGDGSLLKSCRKIVDLNHYDRIRFWGHRNDAKELIARMDCFVLTSKREGMPTSLLEAMSVKTPIAFMSGDGGLRDLEEMNRKEGPFAIVVAQGDENRMVVEICDLLKDSVRACSYADRAFKVGRSHFDLLTVAAQLKNIYNDLCVN